MKTETSIPAMLTPECASTLRALIAEYDGCEVFAIGTCDERGVLFELDPIAFGTWSCVPAPAQGARSGQVLIHNHPSGLLEPSDADINIASSYGKAGIGFYIIDNNCEHVRIVVKPFRRTETIPIDMQSLLTRFGPNGALAQSMPGYEHRPQQLQMMELVANAYNTDRIAVAEAGTGTGKSYAYLAPSILWALENKKRVIISTNTINLQEQLITKDVPELRVRLGLDFRAVLVKGRSNYVSRRRLKFAAAEAQLFPDERSQELKQLARWAENSSDGSRSDLPFEVQDETWEAAMSDKDDCLRARCPNFNECFFYKSRREAAVSDIIIANHHLVMADIALKMDNTGNDYTAILPPYERIVFDEAHNLEDVATSYFSSSTSILGLRRQLNRLIAPRENKGALPRLQRAVFERDSRGMYPVTGQILGLLEKDVAMRRMEVESTLDEHFSELFHRTLQYFHLDLLGRNERRELRVTRTVLESPYWKSTELLLEECISALAHLLNPLDKALSLMRHYPEDVLLELADYRAGVASAVSKLNEHVTSMKFFLKAGDEDYCRWFDVGYVRDRPVIRPCTAPLDVAPSLKSALFSRKRTVILTSATLAVDGKFHFLARQLGLMPEPTPAETPPPDDSQGIEQILQDVAGRCDYLTVGTPFDYQKNCLLGLPKDLPLPTERNFEEAIAPVILETLRITQGRAFVLFTSYKSLQKVLDIVAKPLAAEGITPLRQGEMPRHALLEVFRTTTRAALFATSSFWEGVDVQGKALECLILTKLPFSVPTTPILEARTERIDRLGGSSFYELAVPMAVIRFKQGFGRLIRSKTDRGIVLALDHRILTKHYGKMFLGSLPPVSRAQGTSDEVLEKFRLFYHQ